ncbi:MAG: protein kinase [Chloroflexi bacterium]|nr:protein kinase [Chloroflexota bacterium]
MPGETLLNGRYELVAQQGSGGMSVIYKSLDRMLGRMVAIKILRPSLTQDPAFLDKFQQEARSVAMMSHPNIVTVHDVGSDGHTHYIVMEMIEGHDLKKVIRARGALPLERALDYGIQICAGLGFAHRSQLVHADVKPQNILINRDGVIKVTDFGIAQAYTDTMPQTRSEVVWGSPHYFAPEQARGEKPSPASDVYSIGVVMFEMFTGRLPYIGASQRELALAHIQSEIPQAAEINPHLPEEISNIIAKVMSKRPNDRYKHADQLGHILQRARERAKYAQMQTESGRMAAPTILGNPSAPSTTSNPAPQAPGFAPTPGAAPAAPFPPPNSRPQAPVAPSQSMTNAAPSQPPASSPGPAASPIPGPPPAQFNPDGSRRLDATGSFTGPLLPQRQEKRHGLDFVTLILIALAFCAVAGLVPLYLFGVFPVLS